MSYFGTKQSVSNTIEKAIADGSEIIFTVSPDMMSTAVKAAVLCLRDSGNLTALYKTALPLLAYPGDGEQKTVYLPTPGRKIYRFLMNARTSGGHLFFDIS